MTQFVSDGELYERLRHVLGSGWVKIPDAPGYGGTGAPGRLLEHLLGISGQNYSMPDAGMWELKYHSGSAPLTLFHLEGEPKGHMPGIIRAFGWEGAHGQMNFRHTIWGRSPRGFYVVNDGSRITVKNDSVADMEWPYWTHDRLLNAFAAKMRRLIAVQGSTQGSTQESTKERRVIYRSAHLYREPQITQFINAVERGVVAIDFDARTNSTGGIRNHGTKFRVGWDNLSGLYHYHESFS